MKKKILRQKADASLSKPIERYLNIEFHIILIEPEGSTNVGFTARSMKNFGFEHLVLFNPKCIMDSNARKYSMHARKDILEKAQIIHLEDNISNKKYLEKLNDFLNHYNYIIGTSAKPSVFRNIKRIHYFIDELDFSLFKTGEDIKIALLFGRESQGLSNEEINLCDFIVKIPTSDEYTSLNLSHAVTVVLFTIFKKIRNTRKGTIEPSTKNQREQLYTRIKGIIDNLEFKKDVDDKILRSFKNILGRSFSSMKEINLLLSFFLRIQNKEKKIK